MGKTVNTEPKEIKGRFKKGTSGNPAGKPKGSRHKSTMAALRLLSGEAEALTRAAIEKALSGDTVALRLCLDRIVPVVKDMPLDVELPKVVNVSDLSGFTGALLDKVASGEIGATEGEKLSKILSAHVQALQLSEFENRLALLENSAGLKRGGK